MSRDGLTIKSLIDKIREGDWHNPDLVGADLRGVGLINANAQQKRPLTKTQFVGDSMSFYVVKVYGAVDPSLEGPFEKIEDRLARAKEMWKDCNGDNCDNLFKLDIAPGCQPQIWPFLEDELSEDSKEEKDFK